MNCFPNGSYSRSSLSAPRASIRRHANLTAGLLLETFLASADAYAILQHSQVKLIVEYQLRIKTDLSMSEIAQETLLVNDSSEH